MQLDWGQSHSDAKLEKSGGKKKAKSVTSGPSKKKVFNIMKEGKRKRSGLILHRYDERLMGKQHDYGIVAPKVTSRSLV